MDRYFAAAALSMLFFMAGCDDKGEDEVVLDHNYSGVLKLEYSRTGLEFIARVEIDVTVNTYGDFQFSQPDQATYNGEGEIWEGGSGIKLLENGTVTVSNPEGNISKEGDEVYIEITTSTVISGNMKVWGWDEDSGWIQVLDIPFEPADPVSYPMRFNLQDTAMEGAKLSVTAPDAFGTLIYSWTLLLIPEN